MYTMNEYPFIETLDELAHNSMINIYPFGNFNDKLKAIKPQIFKQLEPRIKDGIKTVSEIHQDRKRFEEIPRSVDQGEAVILGIEEHCKKFIDFYKHKYPNLYISSKKYYYEPLSLIITRKHVMSRQLLARYVIIV